MAYSIDGRTPIIRRSGSKLDGFAESFIQAMLHAQAEKKERDAHQAQGFNKYAEENAAFPETVARALESLVKNHPGAKRYVTYDPERPLTPEQTSQNLVADMVKQDTQRFSEGDPNDPNRFALMFKKASGVMPGAGQQERMADIHDLGLPTYVAQERVEGRLDPSADAKLREKAQMERFVKEFGLKKRKYEEVEKPESAERLNVNKKRATYLDARTNQVKETAKKLGEADRAELSRLNTELKHAELAKDKLDRELDAMGEPAGMFGKRRVTEFDKKKYGDGGKAFASKTAERQTLVEQIMGYKQKLNAYSQRVGVQPVQDDPTAVDPVQSPAPAPITPKDAAPVDEVKQTVSMEDILIMAQNEGKTPEAIKAEWEALGYEVTQ